MTEEEIILAAASFIEEKSKCKSPIELEALSLTYANEIPVWHFKDFREAVIDLQSRSRKDLQ